VSLRRYVGAQRLETPWQRCQARRQHPDFCLDL